jgi:hypothetical protein
MSHLPQSLRKIAEATHGQIPILICFSGDRHQQTDEEGMTQCTGTLSRVAPAAAAWTPR